MADHSQYLSSSSAEQRDLPARVALDADALLNRDQWRVIADHRVGDIPVLPGALFVELASATAGDGAPVVARDIRFFEPVFFETSRPPRVEVLRAAERAAPGDDRFAIRANGRIVGTGRMTTGDQRRDPDNDGAHVRRALRDQPPAAARDVYRQFHAVGNTYGPGFQCLTGLRKAPGLAMGHLKAAESTTDDDPSPVDDNRSLQTTLMLDAAVQALALAAAERASVFVLEGIDRVELVTRDRPHIALAEVADHDGRGLVRGLAWLLDAHGQVCARLDGVRLRFHAEKLAPEKLAIAATFTAEPLADGLEFWMEQLDRPARPVFAPFNQIFQELLHPDSLLARNQQGANLFLVRLEDWLGGRDRPALQVSDDERERLLSGHQRARLPNELDIAHLNDYETRHLYQEIFVDRVYGQHGLHLPDGACIVDVGANVGMFTMWAQRECRDPQVYAIEPAPAAYAALTTNIALYTQGVTPIACGLSDRDGEAEFTYYQHSSVFSGFKANTDVDGQAIRAIVSNVLEQPAPTEPSTALPGDLIDELLAERTASTTLIRPIKRLSTLIREHAIERIDLLKIDAEKSELDILAGIDDDDWAIIQQLVLEIHDPEGTLLPRVRQILCERGFATVEVEEDVFQGSGFRNLYARRVGTGRIATSEPSVNTDHRRERLVRNIDDFTAALTALMARSQVPVVVAVCPPSPAAAQHLALLEAGEAHLIHALAEQLGSAAPTRLCTLSTRELIDAAGSDDIHDRETDHLGAIPYNQRFFAALATRIARWLNARTQMQRKVIVADCDNTLWRGVCGEDGALGVEVAPPYAHLHEFLRRQRERGVLLALCSKNREDDVRAVFADNPDMVLEWQDFSAHAINWLPKSQNIHAMLAELSLGLDSVVVLDDNPVECAEITANCPGVIAYPVPQDSARIPEFVDNLWALDRLAVTDEDRERAERYRQEQQRKEFQQTTSSFADFLDSLALEVTIAEPRAENLPRMAQLTQRTNQFNMTTVRRTESQVAEFVARPGTVARVITVRDRFGDYGLVGLLLCEQRARRLAIDTFLLSCRVLGRGVEHRLIAALGALAQAGDMDTIELRFRETARNEPARRFLESLPGVELTPAADGAELIGRLSARAAAAIEFSPRDSLAPAADESDPAASGKATGEIAARTPSVQNESAERPARRLVDIATSLANPDAVLRAIDSRRRRLRPKLSSQFAAPTSDLEREVSNAWQEVLGLEQVGVDDNFFELGGSSLKAVQLVARLRTTVAPDITIVSLFEHPTVRRLARMLDPANAQESQHKLAASASRGARRKARKRARRQKAGRSDKGGAADEP